MYTTVSAEPKTYQDKERRFILIFAKSSTPGDIMTKLLTFLQMKERQILTEFEGCNIKNMPAGLLQ